jgi:hypothetical protein
MLSRFATLGGLPGDPYWTSVSYLLVGNGANGTTTNIKDSSSNNYTTTVFGNTVISTAISPPAITNSGSGTVYFDGNGDYLSLPSSSILPSGTGDFTIELWLYFTNSAGRQAIMSGTAANSIFLTKGSDYSGDDNISVGFTAVTSNERFPVTFLNNTWYNLVAQRASGVISFYLNGVKQTVFGSGVGAANLVSSSSVIGYSAFAATPAFLNGYVYDLRITKGVARYSGSTMTVPTSAFPTY